MMGWAIALILYTLPILDGVRDFDEIVEDAKGWMRRREGNWYPGLAPTMAVIVILVWPISLVVDLCGPKEEDEE